MGTQRLRERGDRESLPGEGEHDRRAALLAVERAHAELDGVVVGERAGVGPAQRERALAHGAGHALEVASWTVQLVERAPQLASSRFAQPAQLELEPVGVV